MRWSLMQTELVIQKYMTKFNLIDDTHWKTSNKDLMILSYFF